MVFALSLNPVDPVAARLARDTAAPQPVLAFGTVQAAFDGRERAVIEGYYRAHSPRMPADSAKQAALPAGQAVERNGRLPSGTQKQPLPPALTRQLPPLPRGYERVLVGGDVVLLKVPTQIVIDVIHNVAG